MRGAFLAVPREIEDSAMLDGAGEFQRCRYLYLPSAWSAMMVVVINTFISAWDDFLWPLIVLRSDSHFTLTLGLSQLQSSSFGYDQRVVMAGSVISVISVVPVLVLFVITQRWFYRGVAAGRGQVLTRPRADVSPGRVRGPVPGHGHVHHPTGDTRRATNSSYPRSLPCGMADP